MAEELTRPESISPLALIDKAIEKGFDAAQLSHLMDLQERFEKNQAAKAFAEAMTRFQASCHNVLKRRTADAAGKFSYKYASFDDIMKEIGPHLAECGLAVTFQIAETQKPNILKITCHIRHGIHVEATDSFVPIPAMTVNDTQKFGAAVSYGKRYVLCAALNIVTTDVDDDATGLADVIPPSQVEELRELLWQKDKDEKRFCVYIGVQSLEEMNSRDFATAADFLRRQKTVRTRQEGGYE